MQRKKNLSRYSDSASPVISFISRSFVSFLSSGRCGEAQRSEGGEENDAARSEGHGVLAGGSPLAQPARLRGHSTSGGKDDGAASN